MRRTEFITGKVKLEDITASHMMETEVCYCHENDFCDSITDVFIKRGCGSMPVVDGQNNLQGIISEFDLLKILQEGKKLEEEKVGARMTKEVMYVDPESSVKEVVDLLENQRLIRVPVIKDGKLVGILTRRDILYAVVRSGATYYTL